MISITANTDNVSQYLLRLAAEQMPFAGARALTWTAQDIQKAEQRELPQRFIVRSNWVLSGVRITPASKETLQSIVYDKDDYMGRQETGGVKTPTRSRNLAIPVDVKRSKRDTITPSKRPRALLDKDNIFKGTIHGIDGIWQRSSNRDRRDAYKSGSKAGLTLLYELDSSAMIKPRFGFEDTAKQVIDERMMRNFSLSIQLALTE